MKRKILYFVIFILVNFCFLYAKNTDVPKLIIIREECNGVMNMLYCDIQIEKELNGKYINYKDYSVSEFKILDESYIYEKEDLFLAGGEKFILSMKPGKYRIRCITPIAKQNEYFNEKKTWESEYLYVNLKNNNTITVVISPLVNESGYSGKWKLIEK